MGSSMDSGREWTEQDANNPKYLQAATQAARPEQQCKPCLITAVRSYNPISQQMLTTLSVHTKTHLVLTDDEVCLVLESLTKAMRG